MQNRTRRIVFAIIGLFVLLTLIDSIGIFDDKSYYEVPHGNHTHYLPKDCDPPLDVGAGPQVPPGPGEIIDCRGNIVPE